MNYKQAFPSAFLKVDDLSETGSAIFTIRDAQVEDVGQEKNKERKLCLHFEEVDQKMALNRTNADTCALMFGEFTEQWIGGQVQVYVDHNVRFGNKIMSGLRITDPADPSRQMRPPAVAPPGYAPQSHAPQQRAPQHNQQPMPPRQAPSPARQPNYPPPTPQQRTEQAGINTQPHYPPQAAPRPAGVPAPLPRQGVNQARQQHAAQGAQEYDADQNAGQGYAPAPAYPAADFDDSDPFADGGE